MNVVDDQEKDIAVGDFDRDSFMDLVVARKSPFSSLGPKTDLLFMNRNAILTIDDINIRSSSNTLKIDIRNQISSRIPSLRLNHK